MSESHFVLYGRRLSSNSWSPTFKRHVALSVADNAWTLACLTVRSACCRRCCCQTSIDFFCSSGQETATGRWLQLQLTSRVGQWNSDRGVCYCFVETLWVWIVSGQRYRYRYRYCFLKCCCFDFRWPAKCMYNMHGCILWPENYHGHAVSSSLSFSMLGHMAWAGKTRVLEYLHFAIYVCLPVVCNVRASYSGDWNFPQCFYTVNLVRRSIVVIHNYCPWMVQARYCLY